MNFYNDERSSDDSSSDQFKGQLRGAPRRQPTRNDSQQQQFFRSSAFESEQGGGHQLVQQSESLNPNQTQPNKAQLNLQPRFQEEQKDQLMYRPRLQNIPSQMIQQRKQNGADLQLSQMRNQKYPIQKGQDLTIQVAPMIREQPWPEEKNGYSQTEFLVDNRGMKDSRQLFQMQHSVGQQRFNQPAQTQQRNALIMSENHRQPKEQVQKQVMQKYDHDQSVSEEELQDRCECEFCGNKIFMVDLDAHESACSALQSEKEIARIQKQQIRDAFSARPDSNFMADPLVQQSRTQIMNDSFGANDAESENVPRFTKTTHPSGVVPVPRPHRNHFGMNVSDEEFDHSGGNANEVIPQSRSREPERNIFQYSTGRTRQRYGQGSETQQNQGLNPGGAMQPVANRRQQQSQRALFDVGDGLNNHLNHQRDIRSILQEDSPESQPVSRIQAPLSRRIDTYHQAQSLFGDHHAREPSMEHADEEYDDDEMQSNGYENENNQFEGASDSALLRQIAMWRQNIHHGQFDEEQDEYGDEEEDIGGIQLYPNDSDEDVNPVPPDLLAALPINKFTQANNLNFSEENKLCTICQSNYEVGEEYMMLMCLHRFHQACVGQWFQTKDTCPICKQQVNIQQQHHQSRPESRIQAQQSPIPSDIQINRMFARMQIEDEDELGQEFQQQNYPFNSFTQRRHNNFEVSELINDNQERRAEREQALRGVRQILQADEAVISFESRVQDLNQNLEAQPQRHLLINRQQMNSASIQIGKQRSYERSAFDSSSDEEF